MRTAEDTQTSLAVVMKIAVADPAGPPGLELAYARMIDRLLVSGEETDFYN